MAKCDKDSIVARYCWLSGIHLVYDSYAVARIFFIQSISNIQRFISTAVIYYDYLKILKSLTDNAFNTFC
ncbi:hypothetical protein JCM31598_02360 [Desulfonatronum parangueonense]